MMILLGKNKTRYSTQCNVIVLKSFGKLFHERDLMCAGPQHRRSFLR